MVLAQAPGVISQQGTDTFITTAIPPTMVTTANFFVGFLITHTAGQFPAAFDESAPIPNRSWIALTSSINDLSGAAPIESASAWLAIGSFVPTAIPEANPNGHSKPDADCDGDSLRADLHDGY